MDRCIIISNGRCGSTLLSDLIRDEPSTCSAQEFFHSMAPWSRIEVLTGAEYWTVLSSLKPELSVLFRLGVPPPEVRYPAERPLGRTIWPSCRASWRSPCPSSPPTRTRSSTGWPSASGLSPPECWLHTTGRSSTSAPDMLGRKRWVERSGGSTQWAPSLLAEYPERPVRLSDPQLARHR